MKGVVLKIASPDDQSCPSGHRHGSLGAALAFAYYKPPVAQVHMG